MFFLNYPSYSTMQVSFGIELLLDSVAFFLHVTYVNRTLYHRMNISLKTLKKLNKMVRLLGVSDAVDSQLLYCYWQISNAVFSPDKRKGRCDS